VRVVPALGSAEITPFNNSVTLVPPSWIAFGAGCVGANGVPSLQVTRLPELGETFELEAQNLAGGLAVMVTGLSPVNVPLQVLGLGFGAGCSLLVTLDVLEFLPQTAGEATWSFVIPNAPALQGLHLYNQVVEFAATPAVSNGGDAVIE
jgi:hypothetical protein